MCLISPISCCHLPFAPLGQVNEWTAKSSPFSIHGRLSEFFRSIAAKILKNPYRQWRSKFARRGGKPKFKITEKFLYWKLGPHFVSVVIQRMFSSWVRQRTLWFLFVVSILSFHSSIKSTFLVNKELLCLYDKQNNTWLLVDMKCLFSCSTRHLPRSLRSRVGYRFKHSKRNPISTRASILYLSQCPPTDVAQKLS